MISPIDVGLECLLRTLMDEVSVHVGRPDLSAFRIMIDTGSEHYYDAKAQISPCYPRGLFAD